MALCIETDLCPRIFATARRARGERKAVRKGCQLRRPLTERVLFKVESLGLAGLRLLLLLLLSRACACAATHLLNKAEDKALDISGSRNL